MRTPSTSSYTDEPMWANNIANRCRDTLRSVATLVWPAAHRLDRLPPSDLLLGGLLRRSTGVVRSGVPGAGVRAVVAEGDDRGITRDQGRGYPPMPDGRVKASPRRHPFGYAARFWTAIGIRRGGGLRSSTDAVRRRAPPFPQGAKAVVLQAPDSPLWEAASSVPADRGPKGNLEVREEAEEYLDHPCTKTESRDGEGGVRALFGPTGTFWGTPPRRRRRPGRRTGRCVSGRRGWR